MILHHIWRSLTLLALCASTMSSNQQHLVCKNIEDAFVESGSSEAESRYSPHQGAPGKMGPPGVPGPDGMPGNNGPPGTVDYDRIKEVIGIEVGNYLEGITSTIAELTRNLSVLTREIDCTRQGGVLLTGICFTVPYLSSSRDTNYDKAVAECAKHGALLAEFHDRAQQDAVEGLVRKIMPHDLSFAEFHLGMKYNPSTSNVLYRSGIAVAADRSQLKWYPSHPTSSSSREYLVLLVRRDSTSASHGLYNYVHTHSVHGVICENRI